MRPHKNLTKGTNYPYLTTGIEMGASGKHLGAMSTTTHQSLKCLAFGFLGAAMFALIQHGGPAFAQAAKALVTLQSSTPGQTQVGHVNVSGTVRAGQFVGGGSGLTSVTATSLGGFAASDFGFIERDNEWRGRNVFADSANSFNGAFSGDGSALSGVNASQLGGFASTSFGKLATANVWQGANTFNSPSNVFNGNGGGLTGVTAVALELPYDDQFGVAGPTSAVLRLTNIDTGSASTAIKGVANSSIAGAAGLSGLSAASGANPTFGVYGLSMSAGGAGIRGDAVNNISAVNSKGVHGWSKAGTGVLGECDLGAGVVGSTHGSTVSSFGVVATADTSAGTALGAQNLTTGSDVRLGGVKGAIWTNGHIYRQYAEGQDRAAIPIAYGTISAAGGVIGGSMNFTSALAGTGEYNITVAGESLGTFDTIVVSPAGGSTSVYLATTGILSGQLRVTIWNVASNPPAKISTSFSFVVFRSNPDNPN